MENNSSILKRNNTVNILKSIKSNPGISRPEIARQTGLTIVTVNSLVSELIDKNLVLEEGYADSCGGRKAQTYRFNNDAFLVVGVNLRVGAGTVGVSNLAGEEIGELITFPLDDTHGVEETLRTISGIINSILNNRVNRESVMAVGVSVPGMINRKTGTVKSIPNLPLWKNVTIKDYLEEALKLPVFVDEDTNSAVLYLKLEDRINPEKDMLLLAVDEGVGSGVFLNGSVFHGVSEISAELGHITVDINGPACNCGNHGCVEVYACNKAIISKYADILEDNGKKAEQVRNKLGSRRRENEFILMMGKLAADGDRFTIQAFRYALPYIETLIVNAIYIFGVPEIVLECPWLRLNEDLFNEMIGNVYKRLDNVDRTEIKITLNQKTDLFRKAPYMLAVNRIFEYS